MSMTTAARGIRLVVMDMWKSFRNVALERVPHEATRKKMFDEIKTHLCDGEKVPHRRLIQYVRNTTRLCLPTRRSVE